MAKEMEEKPVKPVVKKPVSTDEVACPKCGAHFVPGADEEEA